MRNLLHNQNEAKRGESTLALPLGSISARLKIQANPTSDFMMKDVEELSKQFANVGILEYDDHIPNGFCCQISPQERLLFDASSDPVLSRLGAAAKSLMQLNKSKGKEKCALVLGKMVATTLERPLGDAPAKVSATPFGVLIAKKQGSEIHRALLFKYLADLTSIKCSLNLKSSTPNMKSVTVVVMVGDKQFDCDFSTQTIKLTPIIQKPSEEQKQLASNDSKNEFAIRINPKELKEYFALRPGLGNAKWKGRAVTVTTSVAGDVYDAKRFSEKMEALAQARHNHLAQVLGIAYQDQDSKSQSEEPQLGQKPNRPIPQLIAAFEFLHGPSLSDMLKRSDLNIPLDKKIRACFQIAEALNHLHSMQIFYGRLTPKQISVDEQSTDIKLSGLDLRQFAVGKEDAALVDERDRQAKAETEEGLRSDAVFWAPEKFTDPTITNGAVDVYAFGCMMYTIFMNAEPFFGQSFDLIKKAVFENLNPKFDGYEKIPPAISLLMSECMKVNPVDRPSMEDCVFRFLSNFNLNILQSPNSQFNYQPLIEKCDTTRGEAFERLGTIDPQVLVEESRPTCPMYMIHRKTGNVALVTRGLSNPNKDAVIGHGIELLAEAKEADVGTGKELGASYLFQMTNELAANCLNNGVKLRELIDKNGLISMELNSVDAPPMFTDPETHTTGILIGVPGKDSPDCFMMPGNLKVRIVYIRLLTFDEIKIVRLFDRAGRKALADLFQRNGTFHVSSIKQAPQPQLPPEANANVVWDLDKTRAELCRLQNPVVDSNIPIFLPSLDEKDIKTELKLESRFKSGL